MALASLPPSTVEQLEFLAERCALMSLHADPYPVFDAVLRHLVLGNRRRRAAQLVIAGAWTDAALWIMPEGYHLAGLRSETRAGPHYAVLEHDQSDGTAFTASSPCCREGVAVLEAVLRVAIRLNGG